MSEFISICPKCRHQILCDTAYVGKRIACPLCLQEIIMPTPPGQLVHVAPPGQPVPVLPLPPSSTAAKHSPLVPTVIICMVILVLAAGGTFFAFYKSSQVTPSPSAPAASTTPVPHSTATSTQEPVTNTPSKPPPLPKPAEPLGSFAQMAGDVLTNTNSYQEIFAVDPGTGFLEHKSNTGAGTPWGDWSKIGDSEHVTGRPAAICRPDGTVDVFVQDNVGHTLVHFARASFADNWTEDTLGGDLKSDPSVVINLNHYMEVFSVDHDDNLVHNWTTNNGNSWNGWTNIAPHVKGRPASITRTDGGVEVFARQSDNSMIHYYHPRFDAKWNFATWTATNFASNPWAIQAADSHVEVFCIKRDGSLWHNANHGINTSWSGWSQLSPKRTLLTSDLFVTVGKNGDTEVFGRLAKNRQVGLLRHTADGWDNWELAENASE